MAKKEQNVSTIVDSVEALEAKMKVILLTKKYEKI